MAAPRNQKQNRGGGIAQTGELQHTKEQVAAAVLRTASAEDHAAASAEVSAAASAEVEEEEVEEEVVSRQTGDLVERAPEANNEESLEDLSESDADEGNKSNARFVVKFSKKTSFGRLHCFPGCRFAGDHRPGVFYSSLAGATYDAYCRKCFRTQGLPTSPGGTGDVVSSASSSESSSSAGP